MATWRGFRLALGLAAALWAGQRGANALDIEVIPASDGVPTMVMVAGDLEYGDDGAFRAAVAGIDSAIVFFDSLGGNLDAGIEIGKAIRMRQLSTAVAGGEACLSACALAWLAGVTRSVHDRGAVGFHAVFVRDEAGGTREVGAGNARAGAYLGMLGLSERAATVLMAKGPQELLLLTPEIAAALNIDVLYFYDGNGEGAGEATSMLALPR